MPIDASTGRCLPFNETYRVKTMQPVQQFNYKNTAKIRGQFQFNLGYDVNRFVNCI